uniref:Uncharacterized protein n=1 Tax=Vitis vinifera TaxID=29760 RepID=F6HCM8_VITVI
MMKSEKRLKISIIMFRNFEGAFLSLKSIIYCPFWKDFDNNDIVSHKIAELDIHIPCGVDQMARL